ncbi:hypothetical protein M9979_12090 [Sphingomonas sp. RP10(2022)]|uniref:Uncharacterized protein n=1 Tax=Sphingomonas liriopis TaxID=2949094 RepID=A0A9X2KU55_9SPHN|nr:hypothetical protein [Sphingomonas liriopis]MCP3735613.1 hypothetical protein [Sphingomonas liriopis]
MAIGLDIVVPSAVDPDPTLPYASSIDARINPGSLMLVEPTHSQGAWPDGIGAGSKPNVAWQSAAALIGGGQTAASLAAQFSYDPLDPTKIAFQRTSRGALHAILSASGRGGKTGGVTLPPPMTAWIAANPTRGKVYFVWQVVTRAAPSAANTVDVFIGNYGSAASNYLIAGASQNVLGPQRSVFYAPTGWTGSPSSEPTLNAGGFFFGNSPPYGGLNDMNGRSTVFYSEHLVDIPASGLSFAQLDAIDQVAFTEAFGPGGRFYQDGWNTPASVINS